MRRRRDQTDFHSGSKQLQQPCLEVHGSVLKSLHTEAGIPAYGRCAGALLSRVSVIRVVLLMGWVHVSREF